VNFGM